MMLFFWKFSYLTQEFLKLESDLDLKRTWKYQNSNFPKLEKTDPEHSKPNPNFLLQRMGNFSFVIGTNLKISNLEPPEPWFILQNRTLNLSNCPKTIIVKKPKVWGKKNSSMISTTTLPQASYSIRSLCDLCIEHFDFL